MKIFSNLFVKIGLFVVSIILAVVVYMNIMAPIHFNQERNKRYNIVINKLKKIREAQVLYSEVTGKYCKNWEILTNFIEVGKLTIKEVKDTSYYYFDTRYRMDMLKEEKIEKIIGTESIISKFKGVDYKNFRYIEVGNKETQFTLNAGMINNGNIKLPVFEITISKEKILEGLDKNLIFQEVENPSLIRGEFLTMGSMETSTTAGNWADVDDED